jgi:hypothetical protein
MSNPHDLYVFKDGSTVLACDFNEDVAKEYGYDYQIVPYEEPPRLVGKPTKPVIDWCNSDRK